MKYRSKIYVAGIVLAAGEATRMGRTKQLLPFRWTTILGQVLENAWRSLLGEIILVLGHEAERIQRVVDLRGITCVRNAAYSRGQSTSLKAGLDRVSDRVCGAMFLLGDQPLVEEDTIDALIRAFEETEKSMVMPVSRGRRGNPVIIGRAWFKELMAMADEDMGARILFSRHADEIHAVALESRCIHVDVDTMEDYRTLLSMDREQGRKSE